ncbi:MAG: ArsR family transcriptional regulator, lead/cadmium/zinc/bismuth-responsive transcriptional [Acidimicrobiaceae bacterium]|nr:ArsR family transcriptional regulator, lead/cadmium/zinc/bismuth-responsive transcriptional [Acidimicrobiaceae bacterium]
MSEPAPLDGCELKLVDPARVRSVQASLPAAEVVEELAEIFGLLSDPNRLRLLASLLEGGELCVCDLAASADMAESTTSHALRLLRAHHVVKARRAGRMMHYSLRDGHVRMLLDVALEHVRHADSPGPTAAP